MTVLLASLIGSPLAFGGGNIGDLGRALADWSGVPTVALLQDASRAKPFDLSLETPGDGKDLVRLLRVKARAEARVGESGIAVWDGAWSEATVENTSQSIPVPSGFKSVRPSAAWLKDGKITVRLRPGEAVRVDDLRALGWSRPFEPHWFVGRLWVVPTVRQMPEEAFLRALAAATGGVFAKTPKGFGIDFSPPAFRKRALGTLARRPLQGDTPALAAASHELATKAWESASDEDLRLLYSEPGRMGGWTQIRGQGLTALGPGATLARSKRSSKRPRPT